MSYNKIAKLCTVLVGEPHINKGFIKMKNCCLIHIHVATQYHQNAFSILMLAKYLYSLFFLKCIEVQNQNFCPLQKEKGKIIRLKFQSSCE